jgi:hypothetical protein
MVEKVAVDLTGGRLGVLGAVYRYEVLERVWRSAVHRDIRLLAFGFAERELRLVLEGSDETIRNLVRGLKVGTIRAAARWGIPVRSGPHQRVTTDDLLSAVIWAHRGPVEAGAPHPLASPWCSHRDLLGYRRAPFYDPSVLAGRIDLGALCALLDTQVRAVRVENDREDLSALLRIAGGVAGVLPGDRKCFRLFVHLAKARGWQTVAVADALALTSRRVRQLASEREDRLPLAMASVGHPLLSRVP